MVYNTADSEKEDRMSVSVFLTDVFCPRNRHGLVLSDRILLVWNIKTLDKNAGVGLPGGHVDPGEHYIDAAYRETKEEAMSERKRENVTTSIRDKIVVINHRRLFKAKEGEDKKSKPIKGEDGKSIYKSHWHLMVCSRLLMPANEIALSIGSEKEDDVKKAEWRRFDQLPSGLYISHKRRIMDFYNRLTDKELFDHVFKQKG